MTDWRNMAFDGAARMPQIPKPTAPSLPLRIRIPDVEFCGLLGSMEAEIFYRKNSKAYTASTNVHWDREKVHPFVIELDVMTFCRDTQEPISITFSWPSEIDPLSRAGTLEIQNCVHRAMVHEADESILINGGRVFDPHG